MNFLSRYEKIIFTISAVIFCILYFSLISFNSTDNCFDFFQTDSKNYKNFLGEFGADFASRVFFYFGYSGFILPIIVSYSSYFLFTKYKIFAYLDTILCLILLLFCSSALFNVFENCLGSIRISGGLLGFLIYQKLLLFFGKTVTIVFLLFMILISLIIIFHNILPQIKIGSKNEKNIFNRYKRNT